MQFLSKIKDRDKAPNNALLAKAVEVCAEKGVRLLTYDKFSYEEKGIDPLSEFKHHNGFKKLDYPKYYVPLNLKGSIGLKIGLHHGFKRLIPKGISSYLAENQNKMVPKIKFNKPDE